MATSAYTVFLPPRGDGAEGFERARLVRDGFERWAFLFGPLWFLTRRLWIAAILVAIAWGLAFAGLRVLSLGENARSVAWLAVMALTGLEASSLARWTLLRRGWREAEIVVAANAGEAESKAIAALVAGERAAAPSAPLAHAPGTAPMSAAVLGLFPEAAR